MKNNIVFIENLEEKPFRMLMETLGRIGTIKKENNELMIKQQCYVVKKRGETFILHYKEILGVTLKEENIAFRNTVCSLCEKWGLLKIKNREVLLEFGFLPDIPIIKNKDDKKWKFVSPVTNEQIQEYINADA